MGEIRRKVQVWVVSADGLILLLCTNASRHSFWQPVTGSVEAGEDFPAAATREAFEETRLPRLSAPVSLDYEFQFESHGTRNHEKVFYVLTPEIAGECKVHLDPNEHSQMKWVGAREAATLLKFESNREALRRLTASSIASIIRA